MDKETEIVNESERESVCEIGRDIVRVNEIEIELEIKRERERECVCV